MSSSRVARTLVLLRHGKADRETPVEDIDRPLTDRGRRQATEAGRWLAGSGIGLELSVVSPALRARQTWERVAVELPQPAPAMRVDDRVYAADVEQLLTVVHDLPYELASVIVVGHNPGFEELAGTLTGQPVSLPTAAIAVLDLEVDWPEAAAGVATMRTLGRPPE